MNKEEIINGMLENRKNPAFIKLIILLLISISLTIFSFLPIINYTYEDEMYDGTEIEGTINVKISPIRNIVLMFDSFKDDPFENIEDSELFSKYEDLEEDLWEIEDEEELTSEEEKAFAKLLYLNARINLQSERTRVKLPFIAGTLISLGYIFLTVLLFVYIIQCTLSLLVGKDVDEKKILKVLSAIPISIILNYFTTSSAMYKTYFFAGADVKLGSGVILSLIFSLLSIIGWFVYSCYFKGFKFDIKRHGSRVITLVVAFFALMTIFMPVMKMSLTAEFEGRSTDTTVKVPYKSAFFGALDITDDERRDYEDLQIFHGYNTHYGEIYEIEDSADYIYTINSFDNYSVSEYRKGVYSASVDSQLEYLFSVGGGYKIYWLLNLIPILTLLVGCGFGILTWRQLYLLISDEEKTKNSKILAIAILSATVLITTLVSIFIGCTLSDIRFTNRYPYNDYVNVDFNLSIAPGCILPIILGMAFTAVAFVSKLLEYENAKIKVSATAPAEEKPSASNEVAEKSTSLSHASTTKIWKHKPKKESVDVVAELKKYKELLDCDIITKEEFDAKKAELLNIPKTEI